MVEQPLAPVTTTIDHGDDDPVTSPEKENHEPTFRPQPFPSGKEPINNSPWPSPSFEQETYVIQIPKDQIFSIPPPENSIFAERYQNPGKQRRIHRKRRSCFIITLIMVGAIVGILLRAIHIVYNPQVPYFSIDAVSIKNLPPSTHHNKKHASYIIKLKAKNRNNKIGNIYGSKGDAKLLYKGQKIGRGNFPEFDQDADCSKKFQLRLTSSRIGTLPRDIERSIGDKKGKRHVALILEMKNVPVQMNLWSKVINVVCKFKVTSLGAAGRNIISQQCKSNFQ